MFGGRTSYALHHLNVVGKIGIRYSGWLIKSRIGQIFQQKCWGGGGFVGGSSKIVGETKREVSLVRSG